MEDLFRARRDHGDLVALSCQFRDEDLSKVGKGVSPLPLSRCISYSLPHCLSDIEEVSGCRSSLIDPSS